MILTKARRGGAIEDPFRTFEEWGGEADTSIAKGPGFSAKVVHAFSSRSGLAGSFGSWLRKLRERASTRGCIQNFAQARPFAM